MAILYFMKVTNPNNVALFPPSLASGAYQTTLSAAIANVARFTSVNGSTVHIFHDMSELTAFTNAVALSGANLAAMNEWKTANNITSSYEVFELSTAGGITIPTPFGN